MPQEPSPEEHHLTAHQPSYAPRNIINTISFPRRQVQIQTGILLHIPQKVTALSQSTRQSTTAAQLDLPHLQRYSRHLNQIQEPFCKAIGIGGGREDLKGLQSALHSNSEYLL